MTSGKHPIRNLTAKLRKHDAFSSKNFPQIAAFYLKLILEEPFRLWDKVKYEGAIRKHELQKDPVFVIGHWRSGTSFLQYMLGQDPQFGYLNKFQAVFPGVFLQSEDFLKSVAQKIPQTFNLTKDAKNMSIDLDWDSPSEVEIALTTMISPASPHWGHIFPNDGAEYFSKFLFFDEARPSEIRKWKQDYSYLVKKISLKNDGQQILVKSPGNTSRISTILDLYPNARFIFIHRNPYDIFYSNKKLWNMFLNNLSLQPLNEWQMEEKIVEIYQKVMTSYLQKRSMIPRNQLAELQFGEFVKNPVANLAAVYDKLNLDGFEQAESHFYSFVERKGERESSSYKYEDRIIHQLNDEWEFAFKKWGYPMISDLPLAV